jgi:hypothetical protein
LAPLTAALVLGLVVPLSGCGESKEEKAKKTVCASRNEIQTHLKNLEALPKSVASLSPPNTDATANPDAVKKMPAAHNDPAPPSYF